jgi:hypothetical protein
LSVFSNLAARAENQPYQKQKNGTCLILYTVCLDHARHCRGTYYNAQKALITNVCPSDVRNCMCVSKTGRLMIYLLWKCRSTNQKK